jgi:hypothetical protein
MNENHLRKLFKEYFHYYNFQRTHLGLEKDSPESRPVQIIRKIDRVPVLMVYTATTYVMLLN